MLHPTNPTLAWGQKRLCKEYFEVEPTRLHTPSEVGIQSRELSEEHVNRVIDSYTVGNVQTNILIGVTFHNRDTVPAEVDIDIKAFTSFLETTAEKHSP